MTGHRRVIDVASDAILTEIAPLPSGPGFFAGVDARLSADGTRAIVRQCDNNPATDESRTWVREITLATGEERRVYVPLACGSLSERGPIEILGTDAVLLAEMREAGPWFVDHRVVPSDAIARVDLDDGSVTIAFPVDVSSPAPLLGLEAAIGAPEVAIVGVAVSADGLEVSVVGRDGRLHRLSAETLAPVAAPMEVALFVAHPNTYLPSIQSPVAYSSGGQWLATVDAEGRIALVDLAAGVITDRIEQPFAPTHPEDGPPVPLAIRFLEDGLLIATTHGVARLGCDGRAREPVRPEGEIDLVVTAPGTAPPGGPLDFVVEAINPSLPVVRGVRTVDGFPQGSLSPTFQAWLYGEGVTSIEVFVDDGTRRASVVTTIDFLSPTE